MSEMVDSPLHLEAFFCGPALRKCHHSCVVDKVVDFWEGDAVGEGVNRAAAGEIKRDELYLCLRIFLPD